MCLFLSVQGWSVVCDCGISWSYSLVFCNHLVRGKESWLLYFKSIFLLLYGCLGPGLCLVAPYVGLWSVIVAFPGHTHLLFILFLKEFISLVFCALFVFWDK